MCLLFINYIIVCSILSITSIGATFGFLVELISGIGAKMAEKWNRDLVLTAYFAGCGCRAVVTTQ